MAGESRKRSVVIAGHKTSVSLEPAFWDALKEIAASRKVSVNQIVRDIDTDHEGNLSSAIRLHILRHYRTLAARSPAPTGDGGDSLHSA
jgi:predicted DNA-binding ribbon-helix-helix protein